MVSSRKSSDCKYSKLKPSSSVGSRGMPKLSKSKSRTVILYTSKENDHVNKRSSSSGRTENSLKNKFSSLKKKQFRGRKRFTPMFRKCPSAPHNTTGYLIAYHKENDSNVLLKSFSEDIIEETNCSFFNSSYCRDQYEVASVGTVMQ